ETMWRNFTVYSKQAALESVGVLGDLKYYLGGEWLPGYEQIEKNRAYYSSDEFKLTQAQKQRERILKQISDAEAAPDWFGKDLEIRQLKASLEAVEEQIISLGGGSDQLKAALKELSAMTQRAGGAFNNSTSQAANFKTALADLKNLVPE